MCVPWYPFFYAREARCRSPPPPTDAPHPAFKIQSYRTFVPPTPENELLMDCPPYADYPPDLYGNSTTTTDPTADAGTLDPNTDAAPSDATASDTAYEKPSEMYQPPVSPAGSEGRVITIPSSDGSAPKRVIVKPKAHRRTVTGDQTAQENDNDNKPDKHNLIDMLKCIFGKQ